jgi:hypothetical protein
VPKDKAAELLGQGYASVDALEIADYYQSTDWTLGQSVGTAALGLARGATAGLSDVAITAGEPGAGEFLRRGQQYNPGVSTAAELVGLAGSALAGPIGMAGKGIRAATAGIPRVGGLAGAAAEGGAVVGVSSASEAISGIDPDKTASQVLTDAAKGAALGAGIHVAALGLSSVARGIAKRADKAARAGDEPVESLKTMQGRLKAMEKELAEAQAADTVAAKKAAFKGQQYFDDLAKGAKGLEKEIAKLQSQDSGQKLGWLNKGLRWILSRKIAMAVSGGLGGMGMGGMPGAVAGWLIGPKIASGIIGMLKGGGKTSGKLAFKVSNAADRLSSGIANLSPLRPFATKQLYDILDETLATDLGQLEAELQAAMPDGVSPDAAQAIVDDTVKTVALLQQTAPRMTQGLSGTVRPKKAELDRWGRMVATAVDRQRPFVHFAQGRSRAEEWAVLEAVEPEGLEAFRQVVAEQAAKNTKGYTPRVAQQIALVLNMPQLKPMLQQGYAGLYLQELLLQQQEQQGPKRAAPKLSEKYQTQLEGAQT